MPNIVVGLLALAFGLWGLSVWWWSVTELLRGLMPLLLLGIGFVALAAGITSVQETKVQENKPEEELLDEDDLDEADEVIVKKTVKVAKPKSVVKKAVKKEVLKAEKPKVEIPKTETPKAEDPIVTAAKSSVEDAAKQTKK